MTTKFQVSHCKLDLTANIIDYNDNFSKLFSTKEEIPLTFREAFSLSPRFLDDIEYGETKSFIFFCNSKINNAPKNNSLLLMYIAVEKNQNNYSIKITNWLNWLHNISGSFEKAYSLISEFNNYTQQSDFNTVSDAASYKALQPLLTYSPNKSSDNIRQLSLYEIMRVFITLGELNYSRDYTRNVYNSIQTNLKTEYEIDNIDIADLFRTDNIVNIKFNDEIHIPYTTLVRNMVAPIEHDSFLLSIINSVH